MIGGQINWYRNASEKDNDKEHGTGILVAISPMERNAEGSVVIVDEEGNFVEKTLSLVKIVVSSSKESSTEALEDRIMHLNSEILKKDDEIKRLKEAIINNAKPVAAAKTVKSTTTKGNSFGLDK